MKKLIEKILIAFWIVVCVSMGFVLAVLVMWVVLQWLGFVATLKYSTSATCLLPSLPFSISSLSSYTSTVQHPNNDSMRQ